MTHSNSLYKIFSKNIKPFFRSSKNTYFCINIIFRHLGTKWCSFVFLVSEICPGHVTVPGHGAINLNTVYSAQTFILTLKTLLECLARSMIQKLETKTRKEQ